MLFIGKKTAKEVLNATNEFIIRNGNPKILQADNGLEFSNHLLDEYEYFKRKGIQLIHSSPPRPSTNGVVERVHQNIRKALLAIKIKQKKDYDIRIALINAENAENNIINIVTKYRPKEVFNNSNETHYEIIKYNIKKSQININKNAEKLPVNTYVIISNIYQRRH